MDAATELFIIDDHQALRDVLADALSGEGFRVVTFADARAALDALHRGARPEVALLDWCMPGMSGAEFVRELERRRSSLRVVVHSAARVARQGGAVIDAVLCKPCPLPTLLAAVRRTVARSGYGVAGELQVA